MDDKFVPSLGNLAMLVSKVNFKGLELGVEVHANEAETARSQVQAQLGHFNDFSKILPQNKKDEM